MIARLKFASGVRDQYSLLLSALAGVFAVTLDQQDPTAPAARRTMLERAAQAGANFVTQFDQEIADMVEQTVQAALNDSGATGLLSEQQLQDIGFHGDTVQQELTMKMHGVVSTNVATLAAELRQVALSTTLLQSSAGITRFGALIKTRLNRVSELQFKIADRSGRKWQSRDYVFSMVSGALLHLYVEVFVACLAALGQKKARIVYPDPTHAYHGVEFDLVDQGGELYFDMIKDAIWHPNSLAGVERVNS